MKYYIQFQKESSGITFRDGSMVQVEVYPIDAVGSDGVQVLDGRLSKESMIGIADKISAKETNNFIGYKIVKAENFRDKGIVVYNSIKIR